MNFLTGRVSRVLIGLLALAVLVAGVVFALTRGGEAEQEQVGPSRDEQEERTPEERARAHLDTIPDGDHQGRLITIDPATVTFRRVRILTGEAAVNAAREDGRIGEGETLPGDVYVQDTFETVTFPIDSDARIVLLESCPDPCQEVETTLDALVAGRAVPAGGDEAYFVFTLRGGTVVAMAEAYVP